MTIRELINRLELEALKLPEGLDTLVEIDTSAGEYGPETPRTFTRYKDSLVVEG